MLKQILFSAGGGLKVCGVCVVGGGVRGGGVKAYWFLHVYEARSW